MKRENSLEWIELGKDNSFYIVTGDISTKIAITRQTNYQDQMMSCSFPHRKFPFHNRRDVSGRSDDGNYFWDSSKSFLLRSFLNEFYGKIPSWAEGIYVLLPPFDSSHGMGSFSGDLTFKVSFVDFIKLDKKNN